MKAVTTSKATVNAQLAIARAGSADVPMKAHCETAGYLMVNDDSNLGFVRNQLHFADYSDEPFFRSMQIADRNIPTRAIVTLFNFEETEEGLVAFDRAFLPYSKQLAGFHGSAGRSGNDSDGKWL